METHFDNIKEKILQEIDAANFTIYAAVAWITDFDIIESLINKIKQGVQVELIINDDDRFEKRKKQFDKFRELGGTLFLYKNDDEEKSIMHHKFCVVDLNTTITGSFNWSHMASTIHKENIIIAREDIKFSKEFALEFKKIKKLSVLYKGKRNNYDVSNYATIDNKYIQGDDEVGQCIVFDISQGNKFGIIQFEMTQDILDNPPSRIFGFWKEPILATDYNGRKTRITAQGKDFYDFECLDPNLLKYISH